MSKCFFGSFGRRAAVSENEVPKASGQYHTHANVESRANSVEILNTIKELVASALQQLNFQVNPELLHQWSSLIRSCITSEFRCYHSVDHIVAMCKLSTVTDKDQNGSLKEVSAIQRLASVFHDVIYVQVDQGIKCPQAKHHSLGSFNLSVSGEYTVADANEDLLLLYAQSVFGFSPGRVLNPFNGLNEYVSAVIAMRCLTEAQIPHSVLVQVCVCIEATIPFRGDGTTMAANLRDNMMATNTKFNLFMPQNLIEETLHDAVSVANRDVSGFADNIDVFLGNTWMLVLESVPQFLNLRSFTIASYIDTLKRQLKFLGGLRPDCVFNSFQNTPTPEEMQVLKTNVVSNLKLTLQYMEVKVVTASLLEGLAQSLDIPDAPLGLFLGGHGEKNLSTFLPMGSEEAKNAAGLSPEEETVMQLLLVGYENERHDLLLKRAPLAAFLFAKLGQRGVQDCLTKLQLLESSSGCGLAGSGKELLTCFPDNLVAIVAQCAAKVSRNRADDLRKIATQADPSVEVSSALASPEDDTSALVCGCLGIFGVPKSVSRISPPVGHFR